MRKTLLLLALLGGCFKEEPPVAMAPADPNAPAKVKVIAQGTAYSTSDFLVPGYVTILDFYADWCGPCKRIAPSLEQIAATHDKVIIRKVDIVSWETAAWKQATGEYNSNSIPLVAIYDGKGVFQGSFKGNVSDIQSAVQKALAQ